MVPICRELERIRELLVGNAGKVSVTKIYGRIDVRG
jgi:hypothetical protein